MLRTEEEARKSWCPFARDVDCERRIMSFNRPLQVATASECIGSACMAWRHGLKPNPAYRPPGHTWPDTRREHEQTAHLLDKTRGFCGLAGAPFQIGDCPPEAREGED